MGDKVIIEELCCRECPEKEVKRCLEQKVKYQNSINYILSFIENDDNKEHIAELKKRIAYPTRCDVVLEKQLKRLKAENEELKKYEYTYLDKYIDLKQALEEVRDIASPHCSECLKIIDKINKGLKDEN